MEEKDNLLEKAGETFEYAKLFAEQKADLLKLDIAERGSKMISDTVTKIILGLFGLTAFFFISVAFALALGVWLGSSALGFAVASLVYIAIGALLYLFRKRLITDPVITYVIRNMYD